MAPVNMNFTTRPDENIQRARERALDTLHESNPKLTVLEQALRASALRHRKLPPSGQHARRIA